MRRLTPVAALRAVSVWDIVCCGIESLGRNPPWALGYDRLPMLHEARSKHQLFVLLLIR